MIKSKVVRTVPELEPAIAEANRMIQEAIGINEAVAYLRSQAVNLSVQIVDQTQVESPQK